MTTSPQSKDVQALLKAATAHLTDFQRETVEAVCARLEADGGPRRILVADEVGLGKTLVAKGVMGKLLNRHVVAGSPRPFRVVYICSNQALARENRKKLALFEESQAKNYEQESSFGRLAELGLVAPPSRPTTLLELATLTPATSFTLTGGTGNARERHIIFRALHNLPSLQGEGPWLEAFMQEQVKGSWKSAREWGAERALDPRVCDDFARELLSSPSAMLSREQVSALREAKLPMQSWLALIEASARTARLPVHLGHAIRSCVRVIFVQCCAANLEADLFILDEFQRFRELIGDSVSDEKRTEQHLIARRVLQDRAEVRTLLLSATPFKALSHIDDDDIGEAHAQELGKLLAFLTRDDAALLTDYEQHRSRLLKNLLAVPPAPIAPGSLDAGARRSVEAILRPLICRTERGQISGDLPPVVSSPACVCDRIDPEEIRTYVALDRVGEAVQEVTRGRGGIGIMSFYKSSPWSLSFLGGYQLRKQLEKHRDRPPVAAALAQAGEAWLPRKTLDTYKLDLAQTAPHSKFRELIRTVLDRGVEQLLWIPPSLPYYDPEGPFDAYRSYTKTLLFSSLVLAPRALSGLLSYEVERRLSRRGERYLGLHKPEPLLRFDGRSISPAWALLYPSRRLAEIPLGPGEGDLDSLRKRIASTLAKDVDRLIRRHRSDEHYRGNRWYALAPLLLDHRLGAGNLPAQWLRTHLDHATVGDGDAIVELFDTPQLSLGHPPDDLLDYLVELAIAGPAVCALRALTKTWPCEPPDELMADATQIARAFVGMANKREPQRVLRKFVPSEKPWMQLLRYSAAGNLQSVLDEYIHMLEGSGSEGRKAAVQALIEAMGLPPSHVVAQFRLPPANGGRKHEGNLRCHFAVPMGNQKSDDDQAVQRIGNVRTAFNSPFWPFVLNSTSIGQEGLDFHWYCSRIVHWNLPSNPIDLEQREGRINRFKCLVVRRRLAERYGPAATFAPGSNPWNEMFARATASADARRSDLVPFWHVPGGSAQMERVVPMFRFSREVLRLREILKVLSLYRFSFGQPRQQDLIETLLNREYSEQDLIEMRRALIIDLAPINYRGARRENT